jgi:hypothetical protein
MWGEGVGWDGQGGVVVSSLERVGDLVKEGRIIQVGGEGWGVGVIGNGNWRWL